MVGDSEWWQEGILSPQPLLRSDSWCSEQPHQQDSLSISSSPSMQQLVLHDHSPLEHHRRKGLSVCYQIRNTVKDRHVLGNTRGSSPRWKLKLSSHLSSISTLKTSPSLPHNHPWLPLDFPNSCKAAFLKLNAERDAHDEINGLS